MGTSSFLLSRSCTSSVGGRRTFPTASLASRMKPRRHSLFNEAQSPYEAAAFSLPAAVKTTSSFSASTSTDDLDSDDLDADVDVNMVALMTPPRRRRRSPWWSLSRLLPSQKAASHSIYYYPFTRRKPWYMYSPYQVPRQTPTKRFCRVAFIALLLGACMLMRLVFILNQPRPHHGLFESPASDLIVHGEPVKLLPKPQYPLDPFPESPMYSSTVGADDPTKPPSPWLVTVISPATDAARRMLIRSTWMRLYRDVPFDARFVISNPGPRWMENIRIENRTFGDMIVLDHLQEDAVTANTVKTIELYKWLIGHNRKYEFVSKMDTDLFFNARGFWNRYLTPLLANQTGTPEATVERTIIGELYYSARHDLVFPHGAMYTATWDMVELLSDLQDRYHVVTGEDMAVAMLMLRGKEVANMINFKGSEKFDYEDADSRGDGTAWARSKSHGNATSHAITGQDALAVHELKDERLFLKVADCFDEHGIKEDPQGRDRRAPLKMWWWDLLHRFNLTIHWMSRFERIPDFLWRFDNGSWICDGIWRLGRARTGYLEELEP